MEHKREKYERLIAPILVGPSARIVSVAEEGGMRPLCASASVVRRHGSACRSRSVLECAPWATYQHARQPGLGAGHPGQ